MNMNGKYTIHGSKIDEIIHQKLKIIVNEMVRDLPEVISILLTGGFGRGEGSIKIIDGNVVPLKDFDFLLFFERDIPSNRISKLGKRLRDKIATHDSCDLYPYNSFTLDLNATTLDRCNMLPDITTYEAKVASQVLYGKDIRDQIDIKYENIPLRTGARILFQKGISLIGQFSPDYLLNSELPEDKKEMFIYEVTKVFVELGTSLSILTGVYEPSYKKRGEIFSERYEELLPELFQILPNLGEKIHYYTEFKLKPDFNVIDDPITLWFTARKYLLEVLKYYMTNYLEIGDFKDYNSFCYQVRHQLRHEYYKPLISNVIDSKLNVKLPIKFLSIFNNLFQIYGNLNYIRNINKNINYSSTDININFYCPTLDFFYATLLLLNSIDDKGNINMKNLNYVNKALNLKPKNDKHPNNAWDNTRETYLESLHLLPYMY